MIAGDRTYLERKLQEHLQFHSEPLMNIDGVYVRGTDGALYQLQNVMKSGRNPDPEGPFWKTEYCPSSEFPDDVVLVIRVGEVLRLQEMLSHSSSQATAAEQKQSSRERDSMLKLIVAMAIDGYGLDVAAKRSPVPGDLSEATQRLGIPLSDDTIRAFLAAGAQLLPRG